MSKRYTNEERLDTFVIWRASKSVEEAVKNSGVPYETMRDWCKKAGVQNPTSLLGQTAPVAKGVLAHTGVPIPFRPTLTDFDRAVDFTWPANLEGVGIVQAPRRVQKILVCPDAHHPHADKRAWACFLEANRVLRPDAVVCIGDFADCDSVSFHDKGPMSEGSLKKEISLVSDALDEWDFALPYECRKYFCEGNHEFRITRYLNQNAPAFEGLLSLQSLLRFEDRGWHFTPYKQSLRIGQMTFTHDIGRCGKYTASQSLADYGDNIVVGHSHRASVVYAGTVGGSTHVAMNVGNLVSYDSIDYRHKDLAHREWQHGFGLIYQTEDGVSWCTFVPIIDGRCVVEGKEIRA